MHPSGRRRRVSEFLPKIKNSFGEMFAI